MPEWLQILLAVAGSLNVVGFVAWVIKSIYELKSRLAAAEQRMKAAEEAAEAIRADCRFCGDTKRELFEKLNYLARVVAALAERAGVDLSKFRME